MTDEGNLDSWSRGRARLRHLAKQLGVQPSELYDEVFSAKHGKLSNSLYALGQPEYAWMGTDNALVLYKAWRAKHHG